MGVMTREQSTIVEQEPLRMKTGTHTATPIKGREWMVVGSTEITGKITLTEPLEFDVRYRIERYWPKNTGEFMVAKINEAHPTFGALVRYEHLIECVGKVTGLMISGDQ